MPESTPRPAVDLLHNLEHGTFLADADEAVREVVAALRRHQENTGRSAKGKLTLTIELVNDGKIIEAKGSIGVVTPKPIRERSILYATPENGLSLKDPRQQELELRVPGDRSALKAVAGGEK